MSNATNTEPEPDVDEPEWFPSVPEDWDESGFALYHQSTDWQDQGLCGQVDPELWFPVKGSNPDAAKRVCAVCPVQGKCLQWALANAAPSGVWGGLTEHERRPLLHAARGLCWMDGCENLRGFAVDGSLRRYCGDGCYALAQVRRKRRVAA